MLIHKKSNKIKKYLLSILSISLITIFQGHAYAQELKNIESEKTNTTPWWINLGLGVGGSHDANNNIGGYTTTASINFPVFQHQLVTARYLQTDQYLGASSVRDAGLLYGLIAKAKYAYASASLGLAWVQYDHWRGGFLTPKQHVATYNTIGVPGEIQLFLTPTSHVGLGLILFGNLNSKKSIAGAALAIQFGNF